MKKFILAAFLAIATTATFSVNPTPVPLCDCKGIGIPNPHGGQQATVATPPQQPVKTPVLASIFMEFTMMWRYLAL